MHSASTVKLRRLARRLREFREAARLGQDAVANATRLSQAKISRIEAAVVNVSSDDVRTLCRVYGVDSETTEALATLAREAKRRGWWHAYGDVLTPGTEDFIEIETDAVEVLNFQIDLLPGLLQVEDYTRALMRTFAPEVDEDVVARRAELRMARQRRLLNGELALWAVVGTPALECPVGGAGVHRRQLEHLAEAVTHPNVTFQVLPHRAGEHSAMGTSFALTQFPDGGSAVVLSHLTGELCVEDEADVARYGLAFRHLCASALSFRDSAALVHEHIAQL
jgi:transcriptional regulator with XRE-family HTH domain